MNFTEIENTAVNGFCDILRDIYENMLVEITHVASFFLNLFCTLVYFKLLRFLKDKNSNDLFKYLFIKSIVDTYLSFLMILQFIFNDTKYSQQLGVNRVYGLKVFNLIFGFYFLFSLELISIMLEVAATFNRYRALKFRLKIFDKIQFKYVILCMFVYSFGFYVYKFVSRQVVPNTQYNTTEFQYKDTDLEAKMGYMHTIVRDGLCVFAIILLNILTMYELKSILMKKNVLTNSSSSDKTQNLEKRLTLMVICMSSIAFSGHSLMLLQYFSHKDSFFKKNGCFYTITQLLFWFSYQINFFVYYFFNLKFRKCFKLICMSILEKISFKNLKNRTEMKRARTKNQTRNENIQTIF
jgi:hypothetical protein